MSKQGFKWTIAKLNIAIKCKRLQGKSMPKGKEALLTQWNSIRRGSTPQISPANSDDEGSDSNDDEASTRGLIFGGDSDLTRQTVNHCQMMRKNQMKRSMLSICRT